MTRLLRVAVAAAATLAAAEAHAQTVRANSTTLFYARQDPYAGELDAVAPLFQLVSITASDINTSTFEDVEVAFSVWGAVDLGEIRRWQNGVIGDSRATGDVDVGYVKGELLNRRLVLKVGRAFISEGSASRMIHLDGAEARVRLPANFGLQAYAGSPVAPRFGARGGEFMTGNLQANFATGGRVSWFLPGRLDVGASVAFAQDRGDLSREDVGADLRLLLPYDLQLVAGAWYSIPEEGLGESDVSLSWRPSRRWQLTADYRHVRPDLFLPRTSILSVFTDEERNDVGGAVRYEPVRTVALEADYHLLLEPDGEGHRVRGKGIWRPRSTIDAGGETVFLTAQDDGGYWLGRVFGAWRYRLLEFTGDLLTVILDRNVNGEDLSLTATATAGYRFARGWKVLVAGSGGTTPYLERHFDVLAKLVYDQTYVTREVP
jgi:hypothetical protein